jgi:hypothetical protein
MNSSKLRIVKAKTFLISAILDEMKLDASTSGLGLEGFKKLIGKSKLEARSDLEKTRGITSSCGQGRTISLSRCFSTRFYYVNARP